MSADALDVDLGARIGVDHAAPRIVGVIVLVVVVKDGYSRLAGVVRWLAEPMQRESIGGFQAEGRVVGLHPVAPYTAISAVNHLRVSVDGQQQAPAATAAQSWGY